MDQILFDAFSSELPHNPGGAARGLNVQVLSGSSYIFASSHAAIGVDDRPAQRLSRAVGRGRSS
jgi:hypothetical protein